MTLSDWPHLTFCFKIEEFLHFHFHGSELLYMCTLLSKKKKKKKKKDYGLNSLLQKCLFML